MCETKLKSRGDTVENSLPDEAKSQEKPAQEAEQESAVDRVRSKRRLRKRKKMLRRLVPFAAILVLLGVVYGVGAWFFSTHYYPGSVVASVDASFLSKDELIQRIDQTVRDYQIKVVAGDFSFAATSEQLGVEENGAELAERALQRMHPASWPLELLSPRSDIDRKLTFDAQKLVPLVRKSVEMHNKSAKMPEDATLELDEEQGVFVIRPEKAGTALDKLRVYAAVNRAVGDGVRELQLGDEVLVKPPITEADSKTQEALRKANAVLDLPIPLAYEGKTVRTLSHEDMVEWIDAKHDLTLSVRKGKLAQWADMWLGEEVDHEDETNAYVVDSDALVKPLVEALNESKTEPVALAVKAVERYRSGDVAEGAWNAEEGRYAEVDVANQVARLFSKTGNVLWESKVVTGNVSEGNDTPPGSFMVYDKKQNFKLLGNDNDGDGNYDYEVDVKYWMPFNVGIGFHDADWRKEFGGDIYLEDGSSGCVNLPPAAAKALYPIIHVGDKVIVR
jgi:lipoprotein-anchoring transpeptidase ErfK/SrfK